MMIRGLVGVVAVLSMSQPALAQSLAVTPGMWESTAVVESPLFGSRKSTTSECIRENAYDPKKMMEGMDPDQCTMQTDVSGNTMTFELKCEQPGMGLMTGEGKITVDGDTMTGTMSMSGDMGGQQMTMSVNSSGKRIGDC